MLRVNDLHAAYGDIGVLKGISLEISPGEIVCLLGANGAGKSTLLKVISGVLHPSRGNVLFQDQEITRYSAHQIVRMGLSHVPEGRQIFSRLTVMQNLILGGYPRKSKKSEAQELFEFISNLFPILRERLKQKAGTLSGGEQQMLAISRSLMSRPNLLLLDEPSLGLAPLVVEEIFRVIKDLRSRGISILLVEQNVMGALNIADRGYVMEIGKVAAHGKAADMRGDDEVRRRYLGK
ncbi:MAG TPA: ABC transporter ATP-binding protein [Thermodesulfobacteriota bacterium]|nr:ABC transporter ATP-binding protein [Thermodesulfobacteriota bacterium]